MCVFCSIVSGDIPAKKLFENENFIVIRDVDPKAKQHYLAITKKHFKLLSEADDNGQKMVADILKTLPKISQSLGLSGGYRIVINQGDDAGQSVPHLHMHILGGEHLGWTPN